MRKSEGPLRRSSRVTLGAVLLSSVALIVFASIYDFTRDYENGYLFTNLILLTVIIVWMLAVSAMAFNAFVDSEIKRDARFHGQTACWVAAGVFFTSLGWVLLVEVWDQFLPDNRGRAIWSWMLLMFCFVVTGLPMYLGEIRRNRADF